MLTAIRPHHRNDEREALLVVARWWQRLHFDWDRFLLGWSAAFHLLTAFTLAAAPLDQVLTEGTRPVLDLASRYTWAVVFAAVGVALLALLHRPWPRWLLVLTWFAVLFLGGMWLTAFSLAVFRGEGSAIGVVVWPFLYGPWAIVAFRSLGKR